MTPQIERAVSDLLQLMQDTTTNDERVEVFDFLTAIYCPHCGRDKGGRICHCTNQEDKDAARYRRLRELSEIGQDWKVNRTRINEDGRPERQWMHGETLDAAIDAALATAKEPRHD
jgi:hypothetical protein